MGTKFWECTESHYINHTTSEANTMCYYEYTLNYMYMGITGKGCVQDRVQNVHMSSKLSATTAMTKMIQLKPYEPDFTESNNDPPIHSTSKLSTMCYNIN